MIVGTLHIALEQHALVNLCLKWIIWQELMGL